MYNLTFFKLTTTDDFCVFSESTLSIGIMYLFINIVMYPITIIAIKEYKIIRPYKIYIYIYMTILYLIVLVLLLTTSIFYALLLYMLADVLSHIINAIPLLNIRVIRYTGDVTIHHIFTFVALCILDAVPYRCDYFYYLTLINIFRVFLRSLMTILYLYNKKSTNIILIIFILTSLLIIEISYITSIALFINNYTFIFSLIFVFTDYKFSWILIKKIYNKYKINNNIDTNIISINEDLETKSSNTK